MENETYSDIQKQDNLQIPVITTRRKTPIIQTEKRVSVLAAFKKVTQISKKATRSVNLPRIYAANARSLFPKFEDFTNTLTHYNIDVATISETWEDVNDTNHAKYIDILRNVYGYDWHSLA